MVLCVRALDQWFNDAAALWGYSWAVLELMLVRVEKQKHGHGTGTVKKVAMVEFYWCWLMFSSANTVIQQGNLHSYTAVLS